MGDLHRLIAFDLDGTLIDSRRDLAESANQLIVELGGRPLPEETISPMIGEGARVLVRRALGAAGLVARPGVLSRFLEIYDGRLLNHTRVYEGIPEVVRIARRHGRLAILTNKPAGLSERILVGLGLRDNFDDIIGGDGPHARKPDPASLLDLMQRAGVSPGHTLMVGDSAIDHETSRRASVRCCLAAYGFGFESFPRERLTGEEWIAESPAALGRLIESFVS
jgi:phosphoglycolate phosphatase